jgi:ubiquinone/menaquinone biosynthesis C-methylase UbiE
MMIEPSHKPSYWSFGYIPIGKIRDIFRRYYGYPNLVKRIQAPDIISSLNLKETDYCCDLGCGSGFITIELAKLCRHATGIDINPELTEISIPDSLKERLQFLVQDGRNLPVRSNSLDVVLCSEVLMMIQEPSQFLREVRRVLKPNGRLVAVNGLGHTSIRDSFASNSYWMRFLRIWLGSRLNKSYEEYYSKLQQHFGTAIQPQTQMYYPRLLEREGFEVTEIFYSPSEVCARYLSWLQLVQFSRTGLGVTKFSYLRFLVATLLDKVGGRGNPAGQIICAKVIDSGSDLK